MQHELILILKSRKILVFSIFLVCSILLTSCQKQTDTSLEIVSAKSQVKEIPKDWQKIETDDFSFSIPPTMKRNNVHGIDSFVMEFEDNDITLDIEYGIYTSDAASQLRNYEGQKESVTVDGEDVELISYDLNKPIYSANKTVNADGSSKFQIIKKNYVFGIYFPQKYKVIPVKNGSATSFDITSKSIEAKETAKTIFYSIKFKQ